MVAHLCLFACVALAASPLARTTAGSSVPLPDAGPATPTGENRDDLALEDRADRALEGARRAILEETEVALDVVWLMQLLLRQTSDPEIREWVEARIPDYRNDSFFPLLDPSAPLVPLPEGAGTGLQKWVIYLRAAVGQPEKRALRFLAAYLATEESGYILTHQLSALEWAIGTGRLLPADLTARKGTLLARIAAEQAADPGFSDLYAERGAFLVSFGDPGEEELRSWVRRILGAQVATGDWGESSALIRYDGQEGRPRIPRTHTQALAMVVLARYLRDSSPSPDLSEGGGMLGPRPEKEKAFPCVGKASLRQAGASGPVF